MAERKGIDLDTLMFLVSPSADLSRLKTDLSGAVDSRSWLRVESRARRFVEQHRHPMDRLVLAINYGKSVTPSQQYVDDLAQMANRVPCRVVSFPHGDTSFNLITTHPEDEKIIYVDRGTLDVLRINKTPLFLRQTQSHLLFGIGDLRDPESDGRLVLVPAIGEEVSHFMVSSVKTILTLGERHFAMQNHVPTPS